MSKCTSLFKNLFFYLAWIFLARSRHTWIVKQTSFSGDPTFMFPSVPSLLVLVGLVTIMSGPQAQSILTDRLWVALRPRASSQIDFWQGVSAPSRPSEKRRRSTLHNWRNWYLSNWLAVPFLLSLSSWWGKLMGISGQKIIVSRKPQRKCRNENTETILKMECSPHRMTSCNPPHHLAFINTRQMSLWAVENTPMFSRWVLCSWISPSTTSRSGAKEN